MENTIKIEGIIEEEVTIPKNDGTTDSALYNIPFKLSHVPDSEWVRIFKLLWDHPKEFELGHGPGMARVHGDKIILEGTTIEEFKEHHHETLKDAVSSANEKFNNYILELKEEKSAQESMEKKHKENIKDSIEGIKF